ncbi:hypothetical protein GPECTOR_6g582 [Gonium pectorale]|uniref:RRM domain-containing protein n=1 Tax=Gonium pectorale TaxID=33097 RepID=A0A150GUX7_GONPE|nr:hypothetical protein GPECTOR_6g582 [Gonium pectorale]|eukprot:KXZ53665.1 hypothetical protein GPECTOR_6g582 [Gonium pectorale]
MREELERRERQASSGRSEEELARQRLKVTWDPTCREYSTEELRAVFGTFGGPVQDVVLRDRKKRRKATALVVMPSEAAAAAAAGSVCGDTGEPLLVVPLVAEVADVQDNFGAAAAAASKVAGHGSGGGAPPIPRGSG